MLFSIPLFSICSFKQIPLGRLREVLDNQDFVSFFFDLQRALLREKRQRHNQPMMVQPNEERQGSGGKSRRKTAEETRPLVSPAHSSSASDGLQGIYYTCNVV